MKGLFQAKIKIKFLCKCVGCGKEILSSETNKYEYGSAFIISKDTFFDDIKKSLDNRFVDPPVGWSVEGRGNFKCKECS